MAGTDINQHTASMPSRIRGLQTFNGKQAELQNNNLHAHGGIIQAHECGKFKQLTSNIREEMVPWTTKSVLFDEGTHHDVNMNKR